MRKLCLLSTPRIDRIGLIALGALIPLAGPGVLPALAASAPASFALHEERTLRETFPLPAGGVARRVEIDDFSGSVDVVGDAQDEVRVLIHERVSADSVARMDEARREIRLDREHGDGWVRLYVDGPFREARGSIHFHGWEWLGYKVQYDLEVHVPAQVDLLARTVEDGAVRVQNVRGRLQIENVNGGVDAQGVAGSGRFGTVNGSLRVAFAANPDAACEFRNVNGAVDVAFRAGLGADLRLKTMNGEARSDFPYTYRPLPAAPRETARGKSVYHSGGSSVRIGAGGPELRFETINGDILIRQQDN